MMGKIYHRVFSQDGVLNVKYMSTDAGSLSCGIACSIRSTLNGGRAVLDAVAVAEFKSP